MLSWGKSGATIIKPGQLMIGRIWHGLMNCCLCSFQVIVPVWGCWILKQAYDHDCLLPSIPHRDPISWDLSGPTINISGWIATNEHLVIFKDEVLIMANILLINMSFSRMIILPHTVRKWFSPGLWSIGILSNIASTTSNP